MSLVKINWKPDRRQLRTFGIVCTAAFCAVGLAVFFRHSLFGFDLADQTSKVLAIALGIVAFLSGLAALVFPPALRPLYLLLHAVTLPIGLVLSHVIMIVLYYVLLTPIGLVFRLIGRDVLQRKADPSVSTYWVPREKVTDAKRYFNQF